MNPYALLVIAGTLSVVCTAVLVRIFLAYRQYRIAQGRLKLTQLATEIQDYMLDGTFSKGEHCHDQLYWLVVHAQSLTNYIKLTAVTKRLNPEISQRTKYFLEEIAKHEPEVATFTNNFVNAYFELALWKNPLASLVLQVKYLYMTFRDTEEESRISRKEKLACWTVATGSFDYSYSLPATA